VKQSVANLAIFGGKPAFDTQLHVGRPNVGDRRTLLSYVEDILDRRWLTNDGPYLRRFEEAIVDLTGVKHCIAVCNATLGLELAVRALGLRGEVIVPSFTFVATAHVLQWQGVTPVFCDVNPATHSLDPAQVVQSITPRTTGILAVHLWGNPCAVDDLARIAADHGLMLVYDAAHAFGCAKGQTMIGNFGNAEIFSFHATKFLNTFEGGAIVTNDDGLADKLCLMRNFGFVGYDQTISLGTNGKMHEMSAAMGLVGLASMNEFIAVNHRNYLAYRQGLADLAGVSVFAFAEGNRNNYQYVVVEIDDERAGISRDQLVKILHAENVLARRYFAPGCHRMEPYRTLYPDASANLSHTERLTHTVLCLPTGTAVTNDQIEVICDLVRLAVEHGDEIRQRARTLDMAGWVEPHSA